MNTAKISGPDPNRPQFPPKNHKAKSDPTLSDWPQSTSAYVKWRAGLTTRAQLPLRDMFRFRSPPTANALQRDAPVAGLRRESGCLMQYLIRRWNCRNCGRSNATEVALDGTVKCDYCVDVMKIQPSRARGGETPDQLAEFIHADARTRQGDWARTENAGTEASQCAGLATND